MMLKKKQLIPIISLVILIGLVMLIVSIWTGDERWGKTGAVLITFAIAGGTFLTAFWNVLK